MFGILTLAGPLLLRFGVRSPALQSLIVWAGIGLVALLAVGAVKAWDNARLRAADAEGYARATKEWQAAVNATDAANARRDLEQRDARDYRQRQVIAGLTEGFAARGLEIDGYESMAKTNALVARGITERDLADLRRLYGPWSTPGR